MSTGEARRCWRWRACDACQDLIQRSGLHRLSIRIAGFLDSEVPLEVRLKAAQYALREFSDTVIGGAAVSNFPEVRAGGHGPLAAPSAALIDDDLPDDAPVETDPGPRRDLEWPDGGPVWP